VQAQTTAMIPFGAILLAAGVIILACDGPPGPPLRDANVVIVVVDTLRADHLELYGYERSTAPMLARRAADAWIFDNAQSAAPWTAPSLISLVTSLYPDVHGVTGYPNPGRLNDAATTLAEILGERGYSTAAFTEGGYAKGDFGLDQGFDFFPANPGDETSNNSNLRYPSRLEGNLDRALTWLADAREPFFLLFHTYEVHTPYRAKASFIRLFRSDYDEESEHARLRESVARFREGPPLGIEALELLRRHIPHCRMLDLLTQPEVARLVGEFRKAGMAREAGDPEFLTWLRDLYDAEIRYTDDRLERLWSALERSDRSRPTVVAFTSDHGEGLGEHGQLEHGESLFEEQLRVPLLLWIPGHPDPPARVPGVVRSIDLMPTLLEILGVPSEGLTLQGRNLLPVMRGDRGGYIAIGHGRSLPDRDPDSLFAVRGRRWRFVLDLEDQRALLFDHRTDRGETQSVAADYRDEVERLRDVLLRNLSRNRALREQLGPPGSPPPLAPGLVDELRALGYIDGPLP
jgi:arylsulfatase A-like enzyme